MCFPVGVDHLPCRPAGTRRFRWRRTFRRRWQPRPHVSCGRDHPAVLQTRSAFMIPPRCVAVIDLSSVAGSVGVEHPLDVVGVIGLGERQRKQNARFPRLQVVARRQSRASPDPGFERRGRKPTRLQRHISTPFSLYALSNAASSAGVGLPAPVAALTMPFGSGIGGGFDHRAVGAHVREHDVDARQRLHRRNVELGVDRVLSRRLMVVDRPCRLRRRNRAVPYRAIGTPRTR